MGIYEDSFQKSNILTAQVLLTHQDLLDRERYLNAKATIQKIIKFKAIPIINENDVVATDEIRFGDNDTLAAMVCNLIDADLMVILTPLSLISLATFPASRNVSKSFSAIFFKFKLFNFI